MTWPLSAHLGSDVGHDLGDPLFQAWQVAWIGHAVAHEPLHLFHANILWPNADSLAFSDALVGYAPAGLVAQQGPHAALVVYNLLLVFAYALAFLGAYLLAREIGAGAAGGIVAGAAFAYAPWRLAHAGHLNILSSGGIPLALFLLLRGYRRRSRRYILSGWLVVAWQVSLGFSLGLPLLYLLLVLGIVAAVIWWRRGRSPLRRPLVLTTVAGVCLVVLVAGVLAAPHVRVVDEHPEARRTPALVATYSTPLRGFLTAPEESLVWGGATSGLRSALSWPPEETLFPGLAILVLAVLGLASSTYPTRLRIGLAGGALVCAVFSVGLRDVEGPKKWVMPYRYLYEFAPGWDAVRTPGRLNTLTSLALALLAAAGACLALRWVREWTSGRAAAPVVTCVLVGAILLEGLGPLDHLRLPPFPRGQLGAPAPQLHLPSSIGFDPRYSYWSTAGFPAIVNGIGAFEPDELLQLRTAIESFPDRRSVAALRSLGVRSVVLHTSFAPGTPWEGAAARPVAGLPLTRADLGDIVLYRLAPQASDA